MSSKKNAVEVTATNPDFALKKKLDDVSIKDAFPDDVIASAESVIEEGKQDFFIDAHKNVETMEAAYSGAVKAPDDAKKHIKEIELVVFSLKGQSETLGFDLLALASKSLYDFCTKHFRAGDGEQLIVVRKHLDTISLITKENLKGDGGEIGQELIKSLKLLTQKYQ